ncbi:MAG: hypothetical protein KGL03_05425 [Nitrospirota bacterium]|nr:hypothetical protein [Nitrospirota bacterium]
MTTGEVLEIIGSLVSALKAYCAKLPAVVHLSMIPGGVKPTPEAIEAYEQTVYRFRTQSAPTPFRTLTDLFIESLEAFEAGKVLAAVQPLLTLLDHLERMQRDKEIVTASADEKRLKDYRQSLYKIMPGNQPELEGAGKGLL